MIEGGVKNMEKGLIDKYLKEGFNKSQAKLLAKNIDKLSKEDLKKVSDKSFTVAIMKFQIESLKLGVDMSDYLKSGLNLEELKTIRSELVLENKSNTSTEEVITSENNRTDKDITYTDVISQKTLNLLGMNNEYKSNKDDNEYISNNLAQTIVPVVETVNIDPIILSEKESTLFGIVCANNLHMKLYYNSEHRIGFGAKSVKTNIIFFMDNEVPLAIESFPPMLKTLVTTIKGESNCIGICYTTNAKYFIYSDGYGKRVDTVDKTVSKFKYSRDVSDYIITD